MTKEPEIILFYKNDDCINQLLKSRERIKELANPFDTVVSGGPFILKDTVAFELYEKFLLFNVQYVPGKKPAAGIAVGDFVRHEETQCISIDIGIMLCNNRFMHIARSLEKILLDWALIEKDVLTRWVEVKKWVNSNMPEIFPKEPMISLFRDYCGFSTMDTPSASFVKLMQKFAEEIIDKNKDVANECAAIAQVCLPFSNVGVKMKKLRDLFGTKGHLGYRQNYFGMTAPSSSGGASWLQFVDDTLSHAVPGPNNLFIFSAQAGKSDIKGYGGGNSPQCPMTFLVPTNALFEIQKVIDANESLAAEFEKNAYSTRFRAKTAMKRSVAYFDRVYKLLSKSTELKSIVDKVISENVLGLRLDMVEGQAILSPIVSQSYFDKYAQVLADMQAPPPYTEDNYEKAVLVA